MRSLGLANSMVFVVIVLVSIGYWFFVFAVKVASESILLGSPFCIKRVFSLHHEHRESACLWEFLHRSENPTRSQKC